MCENRYRLRESEPKVAQAVFGEPFSDRDPRSGRAVTGGKGIFRQWCYLSSDCWCNQLRLHRCQRIRLLTTQSRRRSSANGLLCLLCAGEAKNAKQPGFYVEPNFLHFAPISNTVGTSFGTDRYSRSFAKHRDASDLETNKPHSFHCEALVGAEGVEPPTLCL